MILSCYRDIGNYSISVLFPYVFMYLDSFINFQQSIVDTRIVDHLHI